MNINEGDNEMTGTFEARFNEFCGRIAAKQATRTGDAPELALRKTCQWANENPEQFTEAFARWNAR